MVRNTDGVQAGRDNIFLFNDVGLAMNRYMLSFVLGVAMLCPVLALGQVVDRIVAVVNGEIITQMELDEQFFRVMGGEAAAQNRDPVAVGNARARYLDVMINDILLRQEAERLKVEVTDAEVENEVRRFKTKRRLNDEDFLRSLKMQGMTVEQFKQQTRQEIMKHRMIGYMVRRKVVVTQEEVAAYFDRHKEQFASDGTVSLQIAVLGDEISAQEMRAAVRDGKFSFDEAVTTRSIGPRENSGIIDDVRWNELAPDWQAALEGVKAGDMTAPFVVQGKWVVLKVLDQRQGSQQDLSTVQDDVREAIMRPKLEERFQEYMSDLRSKALIQKRL